MLKYTIRQIKGDCLGLVANKFGICHVMLDECDRHAIRAQIEDLYPSATQAGEGDDFQSRLLSHSGARLLHYLGEEKQKTNFSDIRLCLQGTDYQKRVWRQMAAIPYGMTITYQQLAAALGSHPRPIGGACAANKLIILIPCHRVIPTGGNPNSPGSYRLGTRRKIDLLKLEGAVSS